MRLGVVFGAIFRRDLAMAKRYLFNTLSSLISIYVVFLLIFMGMRAFGVRPMDAGGDQSLENTVIGFFVWTFAVFSYSDFSWGLIGEAQAGTLEQLYLAPCGFRWISVFSILSSLVFSAAPVALALLAMMATTGVWLSIDLVSVIPLLVITMLGAVGVGYVMGGLALVFKRVQAAFQIVQFLFVGMLVLPERLWWTRLLPLAGGNALIRQVMVNGARLWDLPAADVLTATAVGVAYLAAGLLAFSTCERLARSRGLLGHY
ncbi:MAG: ABC transporter permease [Bacillota bacterium]|jgi:ABC-2 type transport system permease protein|nr:ABC transporter permease [Bacillota bacterium]